MLNSLFAAPYRSHDLLREDDLSAGSLLVEVSNGDDVCNLRNEVVFAQPKQIDRGLAGVKLCSGVCDHLDKLRDGGDIELIHLAFQVVGHDARHTGNAAQPGGEVQAGVADGRDFDMVVALLMDGG